MHLETHTHTSSIDGSQPLFFDVCFNPVRRKLPLIVVLHGYSGKREQCRPDIERLAQAGLFAVAPDIRGRGASGGKFDSGGLDVMDVYEAVQVCCQKYARQIDATNLNVIGYSGGGGNVFSCFARFPDTFRVAASFFGMPDYAELYRTTDRSDVKRILVATLGGTPRQQPAAYSARNVTPAAGNNGQTRFHLFWDEEESACPGALDEEFVRVSRAAGCRNCRLHQSRKRDKYRWFHGYTADSPNLVRADRVFVPEILERRVPEPRLPSAGTLVVPGYVVTKKFQIWLAPAQRPELRGQSGTATVDYNFGPAGPEFVVRSVTRGHVVRLIVPRLRGGAAAV